MSVTDHCYKSKWQILYLFWTQNKVHELIWAVVLNIWITRMPCVGYEVELNDYNILKFVKQFT